MIRVSADSLNDEATNDQSDDESQTADGLREGGDVAVADASGDLLACHYIEILAGSIDTVAVYVRGEIPFDSNDGPLWESVAFLNGDIIFTRKPAAGFRRYAIEEAARAVSTTLVKLADKKRKTSPEKQASLAAAQSLSEIVGMTGNDGPIGEPREWPVELEETQDGMLRREFDEQGVDPECIKPSGEAQAADCRVAVPLSDSQLGNTVVSPSSSDSAGTEQSQIEHDEEIAELEQVVIAAMLRRMECEAKLKTAKSDEKAAAKELQSVKARGPETFPLFENQKRGESPTTPQAAGEAGSSAPSAATTSTIAVADAWRSVSIDDLGLPPKLTEKLKDEHGISTIGQLEDQRGKGSIHGSGLRELKGIGAVKAEQIENAVLDWLTKNRDREALKVVTESVATEESTNEVTSDST